MSDRTHHAGQACLPAMPPPSAAAALLRAQQRFRRTKTLEAFGLHGRLASLPCVLAIAMLTLTGCSSPFRDDPLTSPAVTEGIRTVDPVDLSDFNAAAPEPVPDAAPGPPADPPPEAELSLARCRAWALADNLDLAASLVNPAIADAQVSAAEARFEWLLFGNAGYTELERPTSTLLEGTSTEGVNGRLGVALPLRTGGTITLDYGSNRFETDNSFATLNPSYDADAGVSLSQPLLRGAGVRVNTAPIHITRLNAQAVSARTRLDVIRVVATVDRGYWTLYEARQQLGVRRQQHDLAVSQLERAKRLVAAGDQAEVEVLRAEAGVADGLEAIISAENSLRFQERQLKRLLNQPGLPINGPTALVPVTDPNPVEFRLDPQAVLDAAYAGRAELLELELNVAAEALDVLIARNALLPLASLEYRYNQSGLGAGFGDASDQAFGGDFAGHTLGLRVEVPLGNQAAKAQLRSALLTRLQRLATRDLRRLQITQEVFDALDNLATGWQRLLATRQSVLLEARLVEAERRQFGLGLRTSTEVIEAQTRLADARSREASAISNYQIAQIDVAFATGTLLGQARIRWDDADLDAPLR